MIAKEAKKTNNKCIKCNKKKELPHKTQHGDKKGLMCADCFIKVKQNDLPIDEYSLQSNEMTKQMVADELQCSLRNVEILKKKGKIPAKKLRRRVGKAIRLQVIFDKKDVENYQKATDEETHFPQLEKTNKESSKQLQPASNDFMQQSQIAILEMLGNMNQNQNKSTLSDLTGKIFIDLKEFANVSGIGKSKLHNMIREAEKAKTLERYAGERGKAVWKCEDLDGLLDNLAPTKIINKLPPKPKKAKGKTSNK